MASIALITADTAHASPLAAKTLLESLGHTVTLFGDSAVTETNLSAFDLIALSRSSITGSQVDALVAYSDGGKPLLIGFTFNGDLTSSLGLRSSVVNVVGGVQTYGTLRWVDASLFSAATALDATTEYYTATDFARSYGGPLTGMEIHAISVAAHPGTVLLATAEAGAQTINRTLGARVVVCGFLYGRNGYTTAGAGIVGECVDWLTAPIRTVSGIITDDSGNPIARTVRAYHRASGVLLAETTSDPVSGAYTLTAPTTDELCRVVVAQDAGTPGPTDPVLPDLIERVIPG